MYVYVLSAYVCACLPVCLCTCIFGYVCVRVCVCVFRCMEGERTSTKFSSFKVEVNR